MPLPAPSRAEKPSNSIAWWQLWLDHLEASIGESFDPALSLEIDRTVQIIDTLKAG